jgi:plasmid stabilization system protein ParE
LSLPLRVSEEARAELDEAGRWYEAQRVGLGRDFLLAVDAAVARIEQNPGVGAPLPRVRDDAVRRMFVRRFPYHVVYIQLPDRIQILAFAHDRRRPRYWVGRLPS